MRPAAKVLLFGFSLLAVCCTAKQLGLPRTAVSVAAPNSSAWAEVRNHLTMDPPAQSLVIRFPSGESVQLMRLADDMDWCHVVVWAPDSSRVVFLVQDVRAVVYDVASQRLISTDLTPRGSGYPPENLVRDVAFSPDAAFLLFRPCARSSGSWETAVCADTTSMPVPPGDAATLAPWRRVG